MTDADLLMLENLTYMDDRGFEEATRCPIDMVHYDSLGDYFDSVFTDDVLAQLDAGYVVREDENNNPKVYYFNELGGENSSKEWAAMIRYMKNNDEIRNMRVVDAPENSNGKTFAMRFEPIPGHAGNTVVAFRGTLDGEEWTDNVEGMIQADTKAQREALDYIESIPSDNITVVGHSKGGNKAQYVAILSDKVKEAVSYDGQGFSKAFIDKYSAEIRRNAKNKIRCYGLDTDFVHGLLYNMPEVDQVYVTKGDDVTDVKQNHSPDSFFTYTQNEKGEWVIKIVNSNPRDENEVNTMYFAIGDEGKVRMLHRFTVFVMNVAPDDVKQRLVGFVGTLLPLVTNSTELPFGKEQLEELKTLLLFNKGIKWDNLSEKEKEEYIAAAKEFQKKTELAKLIREHRKDVATLLAYFVLYIEKDGITVNDIQGLLKELGLDFQIPDKINYVFYAINGRMKYSNVFSEDYLAYCIDVMVSNEPLLHMILNHDTIRKARSEYEKAERAYNEKYENCPAAAFEEASIAEVGRVWDFSEETYSKLMQVNSQVRGLSIPSAEWWAEYAHYRWYSSIAAADEEVWFRKNANQLYEKCSSCESKINTVFDREKEIYKTAIGKLEEICEDLIEARGKLAEKISAVYNV